MSFITDLEVAFRQNASEKEAIPMANYMKNHFSFFGIKSTPRRAITKEISKLYKEELALNFREITWELFNRNEREYHYSAMEILIKELKGKNQKSDILLIEKWITTNSWWDSVDLLAKYLWEITWFSFLKKPSKLSPVFLHQTICG